VLSDLTPESVASRLQAAEQRQLAGEPADSIEHGRPTKRDRRSMDKSWGDRWSASAD
jgi:ribosome-associated heat shock protein Hsp15